MSENDVKVETKAEKQEASQPDSLVKTINILADSAVILSGIVGLTLVVLALIFVCLACLAPDVLYWLFGC